MNSKYENQINDIIVRFDWAAVRESKIKTHEEGYAEPPTIGHLVLIANDLMKKASVFDRGGSWCCSGFRAFVRDGHMVLKYEPYNDDAEIEVIGKFNPEIREARL